jgi:hypothetical protein
VSAPFESPAAGVLAWEGSTVLRLAERIEEERDFASMGILADALEEAGCTDAALLAHCRSQRHCRGCGALDAIRGRYAGTGCGGERLDRLWPRRAGSWQVAEDSVGNEFLS